jgi:hypothetical protein
MKARQSKFAKRIFQSEKDGRAILSEIYKKATPDTPKVNTSVFIKDKKIQVVEL